MTAPAPNPLQVRSLRKVYGDVIAVNGLEKFAARPVSRAGMKAVRITRAGKSGPQAPQPERTT